ncbi:Acetyl esterase/lipase [Ruaniaceae bacterium KH17]|nr:Acetyl esterase/lipase [Ruaniaceae bacterium KH17]
MKPDTADGDSFLARAYRKVVRLFAQDNIKDDYEKVRRQQELLAKLATLPYTSLEAEMLSADGSHEIEGRVFLPGERRRKDLLLFFHGGGWVTGDIDSYTPTCATMAELTGCVVISVDYLLAPEHPFPAGLEDCYRVAQQLLANPALANLENPDSIVLIGDSAGGNLAAVTSLLLRDRGERVPSRQILLYPATHWDHNPETSPFESARLYGDEYRLTSGEVQDYIELYVPDPAQRPNPLVAPLLAEDLSGQPRTLVITAELDLLRDEGEAYARKLQEAGNDVELVRIDGALHGFITLPRFSKPLRTAYERINTFLDIPLSD